MIIDLLRYSFLVSLTIIALLFLSRFIKRPVLAGLRYICWIIVSIGLLIPTRFPVISINEPQIISNAQNLVVSDVFLSGTGQRIPKINKSTDEAEANEIASGFDNEPVTSEAAPILTN